jgi:dUTP pyrophosphatase
MKMYTTYNGMYNVGYYLYPRSSTGTKTPLRLSNSVGIIDSGYRGNITAVFDNISGVDYAIEKYQRLVQICPPDLSYPFLVTIVATLNELGCDTSRGSGGFGSTGK